MDAAARKADWRRRQKLAGRCVDCGQLAVSGRVRCRKCLGKNKDQKDKR